MFRSIKRFIDQLRPIRSLHVAFDLGDKNKPTLVLLHGIAATSKTWNYLIEEINNGDYHIVALDLLGFGQSPKPTSCEYTADDHIKYIRKTLKRMGVSKPFILVGHSMGSIISARYCRYYPKEVKRLYLLSVPLYLDDRHSQSVIARKRTDIYMSAYDFLSKNREFTLNNSKFIRKLLRIDDSVLNVTEKNWNGFRLSLRNTIIKQNTFDDISNLNIPVNVIYGALDEFAVQESLNKLALLKNVKITKLPAINHIIGSRFAKEVARQINENK